jgi:intracellular sulfur oxidation DsrE/DsrF family protein
VNRTYGRFVRSIGSMLFAAALFAVLAVPALAGGDDAALKGVQGVKAVFDVSQGSPKTMNLLFWAVQDVYKADSIRALPESPQIVVVFHGPAVKLISSDRKGFKESDQKELDKFAATIRQMKKDGVKLDVCDYALKVMGVDPATIMPEVDHVGNGFISVVGYQAQGYAVVRIP